MLPAYFFRQQLAPGFQVSMQDIDMPFISQEFNFPIQLPCVIASFEPSLLQIFGKWANFTRSQKIRRRQSGFRQKNLRTERISLTATPSHGRSARNRRYRLCALSERQPQDGQVDFGSHVFTTNRTSSERKEIFSIFNRSGAARIVFIHRYFLTLVSSINPITNLPPEPILCESFSRLI